MKIIRKIMLILFVCATLSLFVTYRVSSLSTIKKIVLVKEETMLGNVLFQERTITSARTGNDKDRIVFSYTIPNDADNVKLATWTYSNPYGYEKRTLMDIAADYEKNHPGYIVLGGVNAEGYFNSAGGYSAYEPTNAIVQDGDVIRKDVSAECFKNMICLNADKSWSIKRKPISSENPYLYVYGENGETVSHIEITGKNVLNDTGLCLLTRDYAGSFDLTGYKVVKGTANLYRISTNFPGGTLSGSNLGIYVKGTIDSEVTTPFTSIKNGEYYLATKNNAIYEKLTLGANMKVQFDYLDEYGQVESAIGYMFKYVYNGVVCDDNYQVYLEEEKTYAPTYGTHEYYRTLAKERVGIGFKDNGDIVLMSANTGTGGPCQYEMGEYFLDMGCNNAFQFDGGGSVTFIKRNNKGNFEMLNQPADGVARTILCGLFVVMKVADIRVTVTEQGSDYVKLNREIVQDSGFDLSNIYLKMNGQVYKFNKEITIKNLESFKEYTYELYDAKNVTLNIVGTFSTLKKDLDIKKLSVKLNENGEYVYTIEYDDPDNALYKLMVSVDGNTYKAFVKGVATLTLDDLCCLNNIQIKSVLKQDGKNNFEREYTGFEIEYGFNEIMDCAYNNLQEMLNQLYK